MKKKKKKNPLILVAVIVAVLVVVLLVLNAIGIDLFATLGGMSEGKPTSFCNVNDLESGRAYVWHHDGGSIEEDLEKAAERDVYFTCITGDYNFKNQELEEVVQYPRSIWIESGVDDSIPTVGAGDYLIYVSKTEVPDGIVFERFADYGYTIGVSNMIKDSSGHYYIQFASTDEDDYKYYIDTKSDANQVAELDPITKLYLDKVGKVKVREDTVSDGGTVLGLKKDKTYICEFYTGTFYQDFRMTANIHSFSSLERFVSYDYEFMHSNFIVIKIPEYFKSGYYFVNGVGLFRYVSGEDVSKYNGEAYDPAIDWNDPIILYDDDGIKIYDPSDPDFNRVEEEDNLSDPGIELEEAEDENSD